MCVYMARRGEREYSCFRSTVWRGPNFVRARKQATSTAATVATGLDDRQTVHISVSRRRGVRAYARVRVCAHRCEANLQHHQCSQCAKLGNLFSAQVRVQVAGRVTKVGAGNISLILRTAA